MISLLKEENHGLGLDFGQFLLQSAPSYFIDPRVSFRSVSDENSKVSRYFKVR